MKQSNRDEIVRHYIPELYNDIIDQTTGKEYGWRPIAFVTFKKPYTSKTAALKAIENVDPSYKRRIRIETFKCIDVEFEEVK